MSCNCLQDFGTLGGRLKKFPNFENPLDLTLEFIGISRAEVWRTNPFPSPSQLFSRRELFSPTRLISTISYVAVGLLFKVELRSGWLGVVNPLLVPVLKLPSWKLSSAISPPSPPPNIPASSSDIGMDNSLSEKRKPDQLPCLARHLGCWSGDRQILNTRILPASRAV